MKSQASGQYTRTQTPSEDEQLMRSFQRHLRAENKAKGTVDLYLHTLRNFISFCQEENLPSLANVTREHIEMWLEGLLDGHLSPYTARGWSVNLRAFYSWALSEDIVTRHPMARVKTPQVPESPKDVVSIEDVQKVLSYLEKKKRWRDCAIIATLFDTGMRAGELTSCLTENVDLDTGIIMIPHTKGKRVRYCRLSPEGVRYLDRYLRHPRPDPAYLVNGIRGKFTRSGMYRAVRKCFEEVGIKGVIGSHDLRHSSASAVVEMMTESEMMSLYGWTDSKMVRHYAGQVMGKAALKAHEKASPLSRMKKT